MHDVHNLTVRHPHSSDSKEQQWTHLFLFKSSIKRFIPEISMIAKWDKESTFTQANKTRHYTPHNVLKSYFP